MVDFFILLNQISSGPIFDLQDQICKYMKITKRCLVAMNWESVLHTSKKYTKSLCNDLSCNPYICTQSRIRQNLNQRLYNFQYTLLLHFDSAEKEQSQKLPGKKIVTLYRNYFSSTYWQFFRFDIIDYQILTIINSFIFGIYTFPTKMAAVHPIIVICYFVIKQNFISSFF